MTINIDPLKSILTSLNSLIILSDKIKKEQLNKTASCYALLEELKHNERMCSLALEYKLPIEQVIPQFSNKVFKEICASGMRLSSIKRKYITRYKRLKNKAVPFWGGKRTADLLMITYDKIAELMTYFPHEKDGTFRTEVRINNIRDRIKLLLKTIKCDQ